MPHRDRALSPPKACSALLDRSMNRTCGSVSRLRGRARSTPEPYECDWPNIPPHRATAKIARGSCQGRVHPTDTANFGVSDRRFRFKPAGGFGGNRQAVSVQSGTPLRMGFGPGFGEPPLRDTSYLALAFQGKYSCHYL